MYYTNWVNLYHNWVFAVARCVGFGCNMLKTLRAPVALKGAPSGWWYKTRKVEKNLAGSLLITRKVFFNLAGLLEELLKTLRAPVVRQRRTPLPVGGSFFGFVGCSLRSIPRKRYSKPETQNPKPETQIPKQKTRNSKPIYQIFVKLCIQTHTFQFVFAFAYKNNTLAKLFLISYVNYI